ncbi:MAG: hypothetical protein PHG05_03495 [Candidatus Nanoarchaeia archaeon]|nr:hypothetical protein [Candidatus Nanoarchaeia archaeon]
MFDYILLTIVLALSLLVGYLVAYLARDEINKAKKYIHFIQKIIILIIILISIFISLDVWFIAGLIFGYFFREIMLYLGIAFESALLLNYGMLFSFFIFIAGLFSGMLRYKDISKILIGILAFLIPMLLYFLDINLISFAAGALIWSLK